MDPDLGITLFPNRERCYIRFVQIIAKRMLRLFWERESTAETPLRAWYAEVSKAQWSSPAHVKASFRTADFVADNRVIFDIGGNKFRLVVHVAYPFRRVLIKFVGSHKEYDEIEARTVNRPKGA